MLIVERIRLFFNQQSEFSIHQFSMSHYVPKDQMDPVLVWFAAVLLTIFQ